MLKEQVQQFITNTAKDHPEGIVLFPAEQRYAEEKGILPTNVTYQIGDPKDRFSSIYLELCDKETENFISEQSEDFLSEPIAYFKRHQNEFLYIESAWFDCIGIEGISFEQDDVFKTYNVMTGLKVPKKYQQAIKDFLEDSLAGGQPLYSLMFSQNDGLWELNFTLDYVSGFDHGMTIQEALELIYQLVFSLGKAIEPN
ncbi:branched-chain amino acid aminotransferase [Bacillus sp. 1P06AnD]|uniref:branched-chain amino acid aminotransferase n=1 Tax=Bacillus sp. 1P06AnD TaxID=3132208 RepID=UPI0039A1DDEF